MSDEYGETGQSCSSSSEAERQLAKLEVVISKFIYCSKNKFGDLNYYH